MTVTGASELPLLEGDADRTAMKDCVLANMRRAKGLGDNGLMLVTRVLVSEALVMDLWWRNC